MEWNHNSEITIFVGDRKMDTDYLPSNVHKRYRMAVTKREQDEEERRSKLKKKIVEILKPKIDELKFPTEIYLADLSPDLQKLLFDEEDNLFREIVEDWNKADPDSEMKYNVVRLMHTRTGFTVGLSLDFIKRE